LLICKNGGQFLLFLAGGGGHTPRSYILATEDIVFPSGEWGWHPRITSRLGPHRLLEMPGSHEVLFTNPDGLADKIIEAGRD
jgi:hypothetical protein